jgi:hypothetical protein
MGGINVGRWLAGGLLAGIVVWLVEGLASFVYANDMLATLEAHGLGMSEGAVAVALSLLVSLLCGLTLVFFYAAARPRFGPGPKTAILAALALWLGGYVPSLMGYVMLGLFTSRTLVLWGVVGLVDMTLGALVGGWIYREA